MSNNSKKYITKDPIEKYKTSYENTIKKLKQDHDSYVKSLNLSEESKEDPDKLMLKKYSENNTISMMEAEKLWLSIKIASHGNGNFSNMTDDEKLQSIQKDFKEFHNNFPIVTKYMVCMGQYDLGAFKRYLKLYESRLSNPPKNRSKDYVEEQWIECQANYVRYLWETLQIKRFSKTESNKVFQEAHKMIRKDFKNFRQMHKKMEEKEQQEKSKHHVELLKEVINRITQGQQNPQLSEKIKLVNKLRDVKYKQNFERVLLQIKNDILLIKPVRSMSGTNTEAQEEYDYELKQKDYKKNYKSVNLMPKVY